MAQVHAPAIQLGRPVRALTASLVPALVKVLREKRPDTFIVLAGYPQEQVETYKQAGVNDFIHIRADAVQVLKALQSKLGIE